MKELEKDVVDFQPGELVYDAYSFVAGHIRKPYLNHYIVAIPNHSNRSPTETGFLYSGKNLLSVSQVHKRFSPFAIAYKQYRANTFYITTYLDGVFIRPKSDVQTSV